MILPAIGAATSPAAFGLAFSSLRFGVAICY